MCGRWRAADASCPAALRVSQDQQPAKGPARMRQRVEEGSGFGEGLTAVRLAISTDKIINFIRIFVCARLATVQLNLLGVIS